MLGGYTGFVKSTSAKATGPWHNPITTGNGYIAKGHIEPSLFQDTDGKVYFVGDDGNGCLLKDDMSGCADATHKNFTGQATKGDEGGSMFKAFNAYYFDVTPGRANTADGKYSSWVSEGSAVFGTYSKRYEAVADAGHSNYFRDKLCRWWVTMFGNDSKAPLFNKPAIVPVEFDTNHHVRVDFRPR
jgi:beta-xylosidase